MMAVTRGNPVGKFLKRTFLTVLVATCLTGGYLGYVRAFRLFADQYHAFDPFTILGTDSKSSRETARLAQEAFGGTHWTTTSDQLKTFYDHQDGYVIFFQNSERQRDDGGESWRLTPFAAIWKASDDSLKTLTSDEATVFFDRSMKTTSSGRIVEAIVESQVEIRDNKGTPDNLEDDLRIGPLDHLVYQEDARTIRSNGPIRIEDQNALIQGVGLTLFLRANEEDSDGSGDFVGVRRVVLEREVAIDIHDVGTSSVLPGPSPTPRLTVSEPLDLMAADPNPGAPPNPVSLTCLGAMRLDFPKPRPDNVEADDKANDLPEPTHATFTRKVVVVQGTEETGTNQIDADELYLRFLPTDPPVVDPGQVVDSEQVVELPPVTRSDLGRGPLDDLALRYAEAKGHVVWLKSKSSGIEGQCRFLTYEKYPKELDKPERIEMKGENGSNIDVVYERPDEEGQPLELTRMVARELTILLDGPKNRPGSIFSRGPGHLEQRPDRESPIVQRADWAELLEIRDIDPSQTDSAADPNTNEASPLGKRIMLVGQPRLEHDDQGVMTAEGVIVAELSVDPHARVEPIVDPVASQIANELQTESEPSAIPASVGLLGTTNSQYRIDLFVAYDDVRFVAPHRAMVAEDKLQVKFIHEPPIAPEPGVLDGPPASDSPLANAEPSPDPAAPGDDATEQPAAIPEPNRQLLRAQDIWATVSHTPAGQDDWQIEEAMLRGRVDFAQDPPEGADDRQRVRIIGEAVDVRKVEDDRLAFLVSNNDPDRPRSTPESGSQPGDRLRRISDVEGRGDLRGKPPIRPVETRDVSPLDDEDGARDQAVVVVGNLAIWSRNLALDQSIDKAWSNGPGWIIVWGNPGRFIGGGLDRLVGPPEPDEPLVPTRIQWSDRMLFEGTPIDPDGTRRPARIQLLGRVQVATKGSRIDCDQLDAYLDQTVSLSSDLDLWRSLADRPQAQETTGTRQQSSEEGETSDEPRPQPELVYVYCQSDSGNVKILNEIYNEETGVLVEKQRLLGRRIYYDRRSDRFHIRGRGEVHLYARDGASETGTLLRGNPASGNSNSDPNDDGDIATRSLVLTMIEFQRQMDGLLGRGGLGDRAQLPDGYRRAEFLGDVVVNHAKVPNGGSVIVRDSPPEDNLRLTAQRLTVEQLALDRDPDDPRFQTRMFARGDVLAVDNQSQSSLSASRVQYDVEKELFRAVGDRANDVRIVQVDRPGAQPQTGSGRALWLNRKTGEWNWIGPDQLQLLVSKDRRFLEPADSQQQIERPTSPRFRMPSTDHRERADFNGR